MKLRPTQDYYIFHHSNSGKSRGYHRIVGLRNAALWIKSQESSTWTLRHRVKPPICHSCYLATTMLIWDMGIWMEKIPISLDMLPEESKPEQQEHGLCLLSSKSQASMYILVEHLLGSSPTYKTSSAIWQVWVLIHHMQDNKGYSFHNLGMSSISLCVL